MQRIRFGLSLDGERGWHARDALGESTLGPLGFLNVLEMQLGLVRAEVTHSERVVQMRECLATARTGERLYEKSFDADELGTASVLLGWRDDWTLNGWNGTGESGRIADMAAIETLASGKVAASVGQRLREVANVLSGRLPQIAAVELMDPVASFPIAWRDALARLAGVIESPAVGNPVGREGTALYDLQRQVIALASGREPKPVRWREDGSLRIVRAESPLVAADWLAAEVRRRPTADRLLVVEQDGARLDAALRAIDQPLHGLAGPSAFRPAQQVLPLALRLIWDPLDFNALMQFLTHPVGPLPRFARRCLAEKMASTPGIGGASWTRALEKIAGHYGDAGDGIVGDVGFWLDSPRFRAGEKAPLDAVLERVERLTRFFNSRLADEDDIRRAGAVAGAQQAQAVQRSLRSLIAQGERRLGPETLDRLITQATGQGSENGLMRAEAGAGGRVRAPAAVIEPFDEVCWWWMAAVPLPAAYPWSAEEMRQLSAAGATLPTTAQRLERQAEGWSRPVLKVRECLTLILPAQGEEAHPAWLTLNALLGETVVGQAEAVLSARKKAGEIVQIEHRALPQRRRWWQVPKGAIRGWEYSASYSSLQQFIYNPYQWALNYPAQLRPSALLELPGESQLYGNLAHRVFERLYREPQALGWPVDRVLSWFDGALDAILREEGAVLFMAGRGADREALRQRVRRSLAELHQRLQGAGVIKVEPEKALKTDTPLGALAGNSDLLVTLKDGGRAVVDMKWSGSKWYRDQINKQAHIQLAIYAKMVEANSSNWPAVAYFILREAELLTTAEKVFPGVTPIRVPGSSTALVWERLVSAWGWRRAQIETGRIELVFEDLEPTPESQAPDAALVIEPLGERFNPFVHLAGWGPDA